MVQWYQKPSGSNVPHMHIKRAICDNILSVGGEPWPARSIERWTEIPNHFSGGCFDDLDRITCACGECEAVRRKGEIRGACSPTKINRKDQTSVTNVPEPESHGV